MHLFIKILLCAFKLHDVSFDIINSEFQIFLHTLNRSLVQELVVKVIAAFAEAMTVSRFSILEMSSGLGHLRINCSCHFGRLSHDEQADWGAVQTL